MRAPHSGATTVTAGTLQAGSTTASSPNSAFTVNGVLDLSGFSNTIGSLAGAGTVTNGGLPSSAITALEDPIVGPGVLTAGGDGTSTVFSGLLRDGVGSLRIGEDRRWNIHPDRHEHLYGWNNRYGGDFADWQRSSQRQHRGRCGG